MKQNRMAWQRDHICSSGGKALSESGKRSESWNTWSSRSKPGALGQLDVGDETVDVVDSEHKLPLVKLLGLPMGPIGDNELVLPELDVTVGLLEHDT